MKKEAAQRTAAAVIITVNEITTAAYVVDFVVWEQGALIVD